MMAAGLGGIAAAVSAGCSEDSGPVRRLRLATGPRGGPYNAFGRALAKAVADGDLVEFSDGAGAPRVAASVERERPPGGVPACLPARGSGARSLVPWADEHRRERVGTLVTLTASGGAATFQVLGERGELIGTFVRDKASTAGASHPLDRDAGRRPRGGGLQGPDLLLLAAANPTGMQGYAEGRRAPPAMSAGRDCLEA